MTNCDGVSIINRQKVFLVDTFKLYVSRFMFAASHAMYILGLL